MPQGSMKMEVAGWWEGGGAAVVKAMAVAEEMIIFGDLKVENRKGNLVGQGESGEGDREFGSARRPTEPDLVSINIK